MSFQKLSLFLPSRIHPTYDPKTPKDTELRKGFEVDVENAIAPQTHYVFLRKYDYYSSEEEKQEEAAGFYPAAGAGFEH